MAEGKGGDGASGGAGGMMKSVSITDLENTGAEAAGMEIPPHLLAPGDAEEFKRMHDRYLRRLKRPINWDKVKALPSRMLISYSDLETCPNDAMLEHDLLQKLAIVKLNGGRGASMECSGPKSAVQVREDTTFLDMTVHQVEYMNTRYGTDVPLVLMNSFYTHEETIKIVRKYARHHLSLHCFEQSILPRIDTHSDSLLPTKPFSRSDVASHHCWYPPGAGDLFRAMHKSGILDQLLSQGKEYLFISNVDNLGATVDLNIMYHIINADIKFCLEVTRRTRVDTHGGVLLSYNDRPMLMEAIQVPKSRKDEFKKMATRFQTFNTNNMWVNLSDVKRLVVANLVHLEPIPAFYDVKGKRALQLETSPGSAIRSFEDAVVLDVPRSRFTPVKSTSHLLAVQSNLFRVDHGSLIVNSDRTDERMPLIKLGPEFKRIADFRRRFEEIPDMLELDHLTVQGDVRFGAGVVLRGTVIIVANEGCRIDIPAGSVFENQVITGNLRIMDH